jgi:hypothetical protein
MKIEELDSFGIWPISNGGWNSDARNSAGVLHLQAWEKRSRGVRLLRQLGIKRIRWGYFYGVRCSADRYGRLSFSGIELPSGKLLEFPTTLLEASAK